LFGGDGLLPTMIAASSVSATLASVSPAEKRALKRQRVIAEIVSTEATYVSILQTVVDVLFSACSPPSAVSVLSHPCQWSRRADVFDAAARSA